MKNFEKGAVGVSGFLPAFQNNSVSGFDGKAGDLDDDLRASLENDEKDADGASYTVKIKIVVEFCGKCDLT